MVASNRIATVFHIAFQPIRKCVGEKTPAKSHFDFIYLFFFFFLCVQTADSAGNCDYWTVSLYRYG